MATEEALAAVVAMVACEAVAAEEAVCEEAVAVGAGADVDVSNPPHNPLRPCLGERKRLRCRITSERAR